MLIRLIPVLILPVLLCSCEKSRTEGRPLLGFSADTIHFDTVFTSAGSTTRELRVRNENSRKIRIDEIALAGGSGSRFRLNIDGKPGPLEENVEIDGKDSIFIFVDVIIDPLASDSPVAVTDSILFLVEGEVFSVYLLAWGQDVYLISNEIIKSASWQETRPYVIYGNVLVDTMETLSIGEGARVYFHRRSSMTVAGNLDISGTFESPVVFAGDRLEKEYEDVPGQWEGLFFLNTSQGNKISHLILRNSIYGITIGEQNVTGQSAGMKLFYSNLSHSTVGALRAVNAVVEAANCIFSHSGRHCIDIASGGDYSFTHCTIANQWEYGFRLTPAVNITERPVSQGGQTTQLNLDMNNCVISGDSFSELFIEPLTKNLTGNYFFDHCLLKLDTLNAGFWQRERFPSALVNKEPRFIEQFSYDFRPDTLSPLINKGNPLYSSLYPSDFRNVSRVADGKPDIGAYERVAGEVRGGR